MTLSALICEAIMRMDPWTILLAALVQQLFSMVWFGLIVKTVADYYLAADKGVRRVEHIVYRYSPVFCCITTFAAGAARAVAVHTIITVCNGKGLCDYQTAGVVVALLTCINQHQFFSCQRPLPLLLTECGYEFAAALLASVCCLGMQTFVL
ncbi:hypothetical protein C3747_1g326 [Trypanosoma cruzi]|uniref:Uncharacterized protein n=2 Tax=Trypanosoma cruzi TaxID=5693 RepID=Q4CVB6_TRYCC|nr:hypothetical protein, conserved [Trypanosoma cruzi]EAN84217.1 hypothetical protein, conserved [Trypanosoma cruzi]PWV22147.1 hypothetical protein C3747_1g326 [Trypanosoma cruzi]RNC37096.1 hypothetical protein TcCL_NonESM13751 [Trypanosoma cruzi]|eukprot:XP_806068.1 hypothetical protein [Trypanosoma cruzi strain CL Brener]